MHQTYNARTRLLVAAKTLFAQQGYDNTATSALARQAGTSESQLIRHYGGKIGLLDAVIDQHWKVLKRRIHDAILDAHSAHAAVVAVLLTFVATFEGDEELAAICLLDAGRIRTSAREVMNVARMAELLERLQQLIRRGQRDGVFAPGLNRAALAAALLGAAEGIARECLLVKRAGGTPFRDREAGRIVAAMVEALAPQA